MSSYDPNQDNNVREVVQDIIISLVGKVESRFWSYQQTMAELSGALLNNTPQSSNCSGTPEQVFESRPAGLKKNFTVVFLLKMTPK